jgi:hypothetical protein
MSSIDHIAAVSGKVNRIEWEHFAQSTAAVILLADGRVLRIHPQGLCPSEQDLLALTRDGDTIEATIVDQPEPHVRRFNNCSISGSPT